MRAIKTDNRRRFFAVRHEPFFDDTSGKNESLDLGSDFDSWETAEGEERDEQKLQVQTRAPQGEAAPSGGQEECEGKKEGAGRQQRLCQAEESGPNRKFEVNTEKSKRGAKATSAIVWGYMGAVLGVLVLSYVALKKKHEKLPSRLDISKLAVGVPIKSSRWYEEITHRCICILISSIFIYIERSVLTYIYKRWPHSFSGKQDFLTDLSCFIFRGKRISKVKTLQYAIEYIQRLQMLLEEVNYYDVIVSYLFIYEKQANIMVLLQFQPNYEYSSSIDDFFDETCFEDDWRWSTTFLKTVLASSQNESVI